MAKPLSYTPLPYPQDTAQDEAERLLQTLHEKGVLRLLNGLVGQSDGVVSVALGQLDTPAGRNALATVMVLLKALTETDPDAAQDLLNGTQKGLAAAQASLQREPPSALALLGKLNDREVRRGFYAALTLLGGLGQHLHEAGQESGHERTADSSR